ncbi:COG4626 Phage terminase-like protein, large subunit [uncultured Caudovirales phage]|uniref:COG4626 Phage terminase-like protein, large subunit n=1 Tax=uncultured Caudovirales phage TaxID=2100421 RepID=A0A6J5N5D7_9CAUD|nr:COG4626 Phage terminase-like protein, large subunit [uncultured Caudovirales phage]
MKTKSSKTNSQVSGESEAADYVQVAISYADDACEDTKHKHYGKWIRLAAKRFRADLKKAGSKNCGFVWSAEQANKACRFIECLPHVEGVWETPNLQLEPSQIFFLCNLFGFRSPDGTRRFSTALYAVARKNAKSALAAAIMLYVFCCERENGPQVLSAATTGDQARIVWGVAKRMVEKRTSMREAFGLEAFANTIVRYDNGGVFRAINAKASTQDGLNPSALVFDELHAHKTRDLFDVLRSAAGARKNPLFLYTTTEGYENPGPWHEVRNFAKQVLDGIVEADHFLALYYALDDADSDFDESKWIKANPLLGVSVSLEKMREYAKEAKAQPGALAEFRIKRLNRQAATADAWIDLRRWKKCEGSFTLDEMVGYPCWGAFDLASTRDLTAWRLLWLKEDTWYTWGRFWVPEAAVHQRTERGSVPYRSWVAAGHITQTEGDVTDYAIVERDIVADFNKFQPREIAFDSWNASDLANRLTAQGLPLVQFIQGARSFQPGMQALERAYIGGKLQHLGNPVLTWNAANLIPRRDANMNMAPDKRRSADKIDGMVCLLMAFARASASESVGSVYDTREMLVL